MCVPEKFLFFLDLIFTAPKRVIHEQQRLVLHRFLHSFFGTTTKQSDHKYRHNIVYLTKKNKVGWRTVESSWFVYSVEVHTSTQDEAMKYYVTTVWNGELQESITQDWRRHSWPLIPNIINNQGFWNPDKYFLFKKKNGKRENEEMWSHCFFFFILFCIFIQDCVYFFSSMAKSGSIGFQCIPTYLSGWQFPCISSVCMARPRQHIPSQRKYNEGVETRW